MKPYLVPSLIAAFIIYINVFSAELAYWGAVFIDICSVVLLGIDVLFISILQKSDNSKPQALWKKMQEDTIMWHLRQHYIIVMVLSAVAIYMLPYTALHILAAVGIICTCISYFGYVSQRFDTSNLTD